MNKKSQGLSINVIIIVAIALIVLVVLVAIFTGRLGSFIGGIEGVTTCESSCGAIGWDKGEAILKENTCSGGKELPGSYGDVLDTEKCCCTSET